MFTGGQWHFLGMSEAIQDFEKMQSITNVLVVELKLER